MKRRSVQLFRHPNPECAAALAVCRRLRDLGFESYLVGGCVRDALLRRTPHDYDIVTSAQMTDVRRAFDRTVDVGESFGVLKVSHGGHVIDVASFRRDSATSDGRRPDGVSFDASAEDDVLRRDFTVNALLYDPVDHVVIDHVGGLDDMSITLIRTVGDPVQRFKEDALRMIRAVRLATSLEFLIEETTLDALQNVGLLTAVSTERITQELSKMWRTPGVYWGVQTLQQTGLLQQIMLGRPPIDLGWFSTFVYYANDVLPLIDGDVAHEAIVWAALAYQTSDPGIFLRTFKLSNSMVTAAVRFIDASRMFDTHALDSAEVIEIALDPLGSQLANWHGSLLMMGSAQGARGFMESFATLCAHLRDDPIDLTQVPSGSDAMAAGLAPGPTMGEILKCARGAILTRRARTKREALEIALNEVG